jgi:hypothetical protein
MPRRGVDTMEAKGPSTWRIGGGRYSLRATIALAALLAGCGGSSPGADNSINAPIRVSGIVALTCHLKAGVHAEIGPRIGKHERDSKGMEVTFTEFDWANHRARMIGNQGAAEVEGRLEGPPIQMVFLERTPMGNTMMTSVFLSPATDEVSAGLEGTVVKGKQASVVHSRHTMDLASSGEASGLVSQMAGVCDIKF